MTVWLQTMPECVKVSKWRSEADGVEWRGVGAEHYGESGDGAGTCSGIRPASGEAPCGHAAQIQRPEDVNVSGELWAIPSGGQAPGLATRHKNNVALRQGRVAVFAAAPNTCDYHYAAARSRRRSVIARTSIHETGCVSARRVSGGSIQPVIVGS